MTQYPSHTDETISYLRQYLRDFHKTTDVFLYFFAGKRAKKAAAEVHKKLLREQIEASVTADLTASEKIKHRQENTFERKKLVDEILKDGAHYNFPKIYLISHYAEQIPKFGALG
ncbi:hypothetical protein BGX38DRAFT_1272838 [Terfezia claveryi]|nr:hypothetical protein BGX38DRAFT_1272838 [Terfezia claveryi]